MEIVYDQLTTTDRSIRANRPDILVRDKLIRRAYSIEISCQCDTNVWKKKGEKVSNMGLLKLNCRKYGGVIFVPAVVVRLGVVEKH